MIFVSFRPEKLQISCMNYDHVFDELEISTDPFAVCELKGSCDLGLGQDASATLHYILSGQGEIALRGRAALPIAAGSLVLVPALESHALRCFGAATMPAQKCQPAALSLAHLMQSSAADEPADGELIALCARVQVGLRGVSDVIDLVREPLVERVSKGSEIEPLLQRLMDEISNPSLGSRAMIRAILLQCMIEMLRKRLLAQDRALHWMAALKDPTIWNALRVMLEAPGEKHSLGSLSERVGMSRSAFAKRFADAYGSGPMELLRDLRMRMAGNLLRETGLPVKRIAEMIGFSSRSAFSRTFEAKTGLSPRHFRQAEKDDGPSA